MTQDMKSLLGIAASGRPLTRAEAEAAFDIMMSGDATPAQMGGFLMALRVRGETVDEITAAASVMRAKAVKIAAPADAIDTCGTGGDASGTYNISTAVALVCAGLGVTVAKHGNRSLTSKSGGADVLGALGVNVDCEMALIEEAMRDAHVGFLMAPRHHGATRHVAGTRIELGTRTIFNLLGPLSSPAGVKRQLIGVFSKDFLLPMAEALRNLGSTDAWVVNGSDGLDEMTTTGPTHVVALKDGALSEFQVTPGDAGLPIARPADIKGGDPEVNAAALTRLLEGEAGAYRDIVLLNAAAALIVAGKAADLREGAALAATSLDQGKAKAALARLVAITNRDQAA
ncbi:anthranilate phosphoribosyltransferase [Oceanibaculum pacificum]|uniref:Anthranilate phosphoribosyltransferase n=1 Tax=Oceanibaculum pacificum TaxID=580166 RepID=A0A154W2B7_9PROT|nr:anthranilate phosphoribosyltransferase [Oceanibaculum pacificum]KZD07666.1 anthranilate phosphoribosyltransferase [Oceanibaculum pacificum]